MANYVGIELNNQDIRVLETEGGAKKLKLKRFRKTELFKPGAAPTSHFLDKELSKPIGEVFSEGKFSREPTALSWDSDLTIFRELELPFTSAEQIRKVVKYEAEGHLLNCDIDDVVVSFYKLREEKEKSHVMVMAVRKDQLLNRLEILSRAGVDPLMADLDVMADFNALAALGYTNEHKSFMVLDCGRRTTNLMLISNGRLVAGRAIRIGSDTLVRRIAEDLEADPSEVAEQTHRLLLRSDGERGDDLVMTVRAAKGGETEETKKLPVELARDLAQQRAGDFFVKLSREVRRTLATAHVGEAIEVVYVTGPGSRLPGFAEGIAQGLGIEAPVKPLALLERVEHSLKEDEAAEADVEALTALGLCYKLAGFDETGVDFRQEEARYARKFDQVKEPLLYLAGLALFFVLLLNLLDLRILSVKTPFLFQPEASNMARICKQAGEAYKVALGKDAKLPESYVQPSIKSLSYMLTQIKKRGDELKGELGRGGAIPELPSAFAMWKDTFDAIAEAMNAGKIGKLYLDSITISVKDEKNPRVELTGFVPNASSFSDLVDALNVLKQKKGVVEVSSGPTTPKTVNGLDLTNFTKLVVIYPERQDKL